MTMLDRFSEEIAHFIGVLHASVDDVRFRENYQEFFFARGSSEADTLPVVQTSFSAPYDLLGFEPGFGYRAPPPELEHVGIRPVHFRNTPVHGWKEANVFEREAARPVHTVTPEIKISHFVPPVGEPPGSVANYLHQAITLSDNDYVSVGGHGLAYSPDAVDNSDLLRAADDAASLSPLDDLDPLGSSEDIIAAIKTSIDQLNAASDGGDGLQLLASADALEGIYVNGELVDEAPVLEDHYAFDDDDETGSGPHSNVLETGNGSIEIDVSVTVETGGNTLVNDAVLKSFWAGGTITAVVGDHIELNAIVQINALWDVDLITSKIGTSSSAAANELFNIAHFEHVDASGEDDGAAAASGGYPAYWSITEIKGDLMIVNWLEQITFMSDNDIGIFSSSGSTALVTTGNNLGVNHTSVFELGFAYDLIIIGGSVYDANIIQQLNVLFDNDVVGATSGFQTTGAGGVSSSGNLLWNQASISTVGAADRFGDLPQAYLDAATSFQNGNGNLSSAILSNPAFAGLVGLNVLYISGDLINLQYIRQTNILGDSDQIALAVDAINPHLGANWSITTGSNALLNNASIVDLDSLGTTYVGGEQYSQETLFQAELISQQPEFGIPNPGALVSEAVLFLDDSMLTPIDVATANGSGMAADYAMPADDGVNSMLA